MQKAWYRRLVVIGGLRSGDTLQIAPDGHTLLARKRVSAPRLANSSAYSEHILCPPTLDREEPSLVTGPKIVVETERQGAGWIKRCVSGGVYSTTGRRAETAISAGSIKYAPGLERYLRLASSVSVVSQPLLTHNGASCCQVRRQNSAAGESGL